MYLSIDDCRVRRMTAEDAETVWSINVACFLHPWAGAQIEKFVSDADKFGLVVYDAIVSTIAFALCQIKGDTVYVALLATVPHFQAKGVGKMLVRAVQEEMTKLGKKRVELHVYSKDAIPVHLYRRCGFRQEEEIPRCYLDGTSAYRMVFDDTYCPARGIATEWCPKRTTEQQPLFNFDLTAGTL